MKDSQAAIEMEEAELDLESLEGVDMNGDGSTLVISESALSINGEDSRDSCNQLSIDTGPEPQPEPSRPSIRVAKGLTKEPSILAAHLTGTAGLKRKPTSGVNGVAGLPLKKQRPNSQENQLEILSLEKDIKALQWLARRKEQEWDQVVRLLKQKEERLLRSQRNKGMALTETEHMVSRMQPVVVPQQQVLLLSTQGGVRPGTATRHIAPKPSPAPTLVVKPRPSPIKVTNPTISPATMVTEKGAADKDKEESKFSAVLEKASRNLAKATKGKEEELGSGKGKEGGKKEKVTPACQGCSKKKSEFVCAGCSNRWYCSRECQVLA